MTAHATTHRLRFNDTDRLGHVNNAVFAVMLEQGRSELAVEAGLPVESTGQQHDDPHQAQPRLHLRLVEPARRRVGHAASNERFASPMK